MNYLQIFKIRLHLSHSEEDWRIFEFTPKVSPLFSLVFDAWFSGVLQEEGKFKKAPQKQACFMSESQVSFAPAFLSVLS